MTKKIFINNAIVKYKLHLKPTTLKAYFASLFSKKRSQSSADFYALNGVTLEVGNGCRLGLIGANGSGKSTLLKVISGIIELDGGEINVVGEVRPLLELGAGFHPELSGRENIYLHSLYYGSKLIDVKKNIDEIINFAKLNNFIDEPIKHYSSGMHARLAFSTATSRGADILILDEIFAAGDKEFINKARHRIKNLMSEAGIVVLVSHDMNLILEECNLVAWLEAGKIKEIGSPGEVIKKYMSVNSNE